VTAGTKGIGAAVVEALHDNGVTVVTTARSVPAEKPDGVHYIAADVTTTQGCARVAEFALEMLGGIDIVVHVLGGSHRRTKHEISVRCENVISYHFLIY
jgi:NAD(P)-dependent dehydrogenase (short-subunit alcohol dehydrogenase family)